MSVSYKLRITVFVFLTYILITLIHGFNLASNDVVDVMSYARYLQDHNLFPKDFYVSNISTEVPNERFIFASFLSLFGDFLPYSTFVLHSLFLIFFISVLFLIGKLYIKNESVVFIFILMLLIPFNKVNLGGNELYYNMFIASFVSKSLGLCALYFYLINRKFLTSLLLIPATLAHPTAGMQLFIILMVIEIWNALKMDFNRSKQFFLGAIVFVMTAGIYIGFMLFNVNKYSITTEEYFKIFEFRNAHHFFPQYFGISNYVMEVLLFIAGIIAMVKLKYKVLYQISFVIISLLLVYSFCVLVIKIPFVLNMQWFKASIWLEMIALLALISFVEDKINFSNFKYLNSYLLISLIISITFVGFLIKTGNKHFKDKSYSFYYGYDLSPEEEIALIAKNITNKEDIFIYPMEFTGFKFYSERSALIDFKSFVHRKGAMSKWYDLIMAVYQIDIDNRKSKNNLYTIASNKYKSMSNSKVKEFILLGVNYLVQYQGVKLPYPVVASNSAYLIYKLK